MSSPAPRLREVFRFTLYASPLVVLGVIGSLAYRHFTEKDRVIEEQKRVIAQLNHHLELAWADELVADLRVDAIEPNLQHGGQEMHLTFLQYRPGTEEVAFQRSMVLPGEEVYVDALIVQFDRHFIEEGDAARGKSLLLFRRAFGDRQQPTEGASLFNSDDRSPIPEVARVDATPTDFEKGIWEHFWEYANDPKLALAMGIRVAQGEAPHVKAVKGQVYKLALRRAGGLEITPRLPAAVVGH